MSSRQKSPPASESARVGARFRSRDAWAVEQVAERVRRILGFRGFGIPPEDRRDLEQVVMTQLLEAVDKPGFDPAAGFWAFVEVMVTRRCVDWRRRRREDVQLDESNAGADPDRGPLEGMLRRERDARARAALDELPAPCRELIRMRLQQGKTYAEMARSVGASEGSLRVRMHRCIQQAQQILRDGETSRKNRSNL